MSFGQQRFILPGPQIACFAAFPPRRTHRIRHSHLRVPGGGCVDSSMHAQSIALVRHRRSPTFYQCFSTILTHVLCADRVCVPGQRQRLARADTIQPNRLNPLSRQLRIFDPYQKCEQPAFMCDIYTVFFRINRSFFLKGMGVKLFYYTSFGLYMAVEVGLKSESRPKEV